MVVLAIFAPTANHIEALVQLFEQQRNVCRIILQVGIHQDHHVSIGLVDAGADGRSLTVVAAEGHHPDPVRCLCMQLANDFNARVAASVIHKSYIPVHFQ